MMNRIGIDAMVYGNHEFDLGPEPLAKFIETAEFPVLSGSVDVSKDNLLAPLAEDHLVLEVGGEKVAILGATTPDTAEISSPGPTVSFRDPVDYLTGKVAALEARGRRQGHPAQPSRRSPTTCGRRGGARHRPDRRRALPHAVLQHRRGAPIQYPLMVDGPGRARGADRPGRVAYSKYLGAPRAHLRRRRAW